MKLDTCTNFDTRNSVMKPKYKKIQNLAPLVTSQSPGTKKGSTANNFTNNWNKKLKFDTCTNFDTRNAVMKPKYQKIQNLTTLVTSQSLGTKKGSKANNFTNNWNTKLKFDTCTNFDTRNAVMKSKFQKFQNLIPLVTSQSPGTKKGSKAINFTNNWNKKLKFGNCTNFDTRKAVIKSKFQKFQNLNPLVASQSIGTKKGSKANNFTNNWNTKLKFDTCTNFDTRNAVIKSKFQKFQNLIALVTSQSPGTKKGSKANNFTNNWNKKLKFDNCTNFYTRNTVMKPKYQKIKNLTTLVTS